MRLFEQILNGSIHIERNFLDNDLFDKTFKELQKIDYVPFHQPYENYYGNRFQAYPVNEYIIKDKKFNTIIINKLEKLLQCKVKDVHLKIRKMIASEVIKSKHDGPYGPVHKDEKNKMAAILPFYQSVSGGTAFFENECDRYPDITIGAYPNRLIIFNANRDHAPCNDLTYEESYKLNIFFNV